MKKEKQLYAAWEIILCPYCQRKTLVVKADVGGVIDGFIDFLVEQNPPMSDWSLENLTKWGEDYLKGLYEKQNKPSYLRRK